MIVSACSMSLFQFNMIFSGPQSETTTTRDSPCTISSQLHWPNSLRDLPYSLSDHLILCPVNEVIIKFLGLHCNIDHYIIIPLDVITCTCRKLRTTTHGQILINTSFALTGLYVTFLIGGHVTKHKVVCRITSALLQYLMIVFFSWTAVEAIWLYFKLVKMFGIQSYTSHFMLKAGLPAWSELYLKPHSKLYTVFITDCTP